MLRFLENNFIIIRVKDKRRFKRGISIQGSTYFISDKAQRLLVYYKLIDVLNLVFNCDNTTSKIVLASFKLFAK